MSGREISHEAIQQAEALRDEIAQGFWQDDYEVVYGFPCTDDPRDFLPDPDSTQREELLAWKQDYDRLAAGERVGWPGSYWATPVIHISASRWGMGVSRWKRAES